MGHTSRQSVQLGGHFAWLMWIFPEMNFWILTAPCGSLVSHIVQHGQWSLSMLMVVWNQLRSGSFRVWGFCMGFPFGVVYVIVMSLSGQRSWVFVGSVGIFFVSVCMLRVSVGKLFFSTTDSRCCPSIVSLTAPYGQSMSHIPQKLHLLRFMSILGLASFWFGVLVCFCSVMASFGQARLQIWQVAHLVLSKVRV